MAGADETVTLQIATESAAPVNQATTVELTVVDPGTGAVVYGPDSRALSLDTPEVFTFANGPADRYLVVKLDQVDGHIHMTKTVGDPFFSVLPCPLKEGPGPELLPSLSAWGAVAMAAALAFMYAWLRRRRVARDVVSATGE